MAAKAAPARGKKKTAAKPAAKKEASTGRGRAVETPAKATFSVDDKRAQYARLVVFNFAVKQKLVGKDKDVNSVAPSVLEEAGKSLAGGNLLQGSDGIELITALSKAGATDAKVAKRGLTPAYAAEVRPFIRRLQFSDSFGRRSKPRAAKPKVEKETKAKAKETKVAESES